MGIRTYALMLSVVLWGVLLGGIVYSHLVYFPAYLAHLPESAVVVNGPYGLNEGVFWSLLHPILVFSLIISLVTNWRVPGRRNLIALSFGVYLIAIVITFLYFVPELDEFQRSSQSTLSADQWLHRAHVWYCLSIIRGSTLFIFSIPLLVSLARPTKTDGNS